MPNNLSSQSDNRLLRESLASNFQFVCTSDSDWPLDTIERLEFHPQDPTIFGASSYDCSFRVFKIQDQSDPNTQPSPY